MILQPIKCQNCDVISNYPLCRSVSRQSYVGDCHEWLRASIRSLPLRTIVQSSTPKHLNHASSLTQSWFSWQTPLFSQHQRVSSPSGRALHAPRTAQAVSVRRLQFCKRPSMFLSLFLVNLYCCDKTSSPWAPRALTLNIISNTKLWQCAHNFFNKLVHVF